MERSCEPIICLSNPKKEVSFCWMPSRGYWIASPTSWMTRRTASLFGSWQPTIQSYFYSRGGARSCHEFLPPTGCLLTLFLLLCCSTLLFPSFVSFFLVLDWACHFSTGGGGGGDENGAFLWGGQGGMWWPIVSMSGPGACLLASEWCWVTGLGPVLTTVHARAWTNESAAFQSRLLHFYKSASNGSSAHEGLTLKTGSFWDDCSRDVSMCEIFWNILHTKTRGGAIRWSKVGFWTRVDCQQVMPTRDRPRYCWSPNFVLVDRDWLADRLCPPIRCAPGTALVLLIAYMCPYSLEINISSSFFLHFWAGESRKSQDLAWAAGSVPRKADPAAINSELR